MKRSRLQVAAWILVAAFYAAAPAGADILNPSFEYGLTDWTTVGSNSTVDSSFGVPPTDGTWQLLMSTGTGSVSDRAAEGLALNRQ